MISGNYIPSNQLNPDKETVKVLIEATEKAEIVKYLKTDNFFVAEVRIIQNKPQLVKSKHLSALTRRVLSRFEDYSKLNRTLPSDSSVSLNQIKDFSKNIWLNQKKLMKMFLMHGKGLKKTSIKNGHFLLIQKTFSQKLEK